MITTNHQKISKRLEKKGWNRPHIAKALHILKSGEKTKHPFIKKLDSYMFVIILCIALVINIFLLIGMLPLLVELPTWLMMVSVTIMGLCLGFFTEIIIREHDFEAKHYLLFGIFMFLTAFVTIFVSMELATQYLKQFGFFFSTNPLVVFLSYSIGVVLPHIYYKKRVI